jgi:hypothetical protein
MQPVLQWTFLLVPSAQQRRHMLLQLRLLALAMHLQVAREAALAAIVTSKGVHPAAAAVLVGPAVLWGR